MKTLAETEQVFDVAHAGAEQVDVARFGGRGVRHKGSPSLQRQRSFIHRPRFGKLCHPMPGFESVRPSADVVFLCPRISCKKLTEAQEVTPAAAPVAAGQPPRRWLPRRVAFTPAALAEPYGQRIRQRVEALGLPVEILPANRLTGVRGADERETYRLGKSTLAVVTAPPGAFKLQPIPPSADWQFHLAEGCPAHCQYCYLAGSLSGPPVVRVFANLPGILGQPRPLRPPGTSGEQFRGQLLH